MPTTDWASPRRVIPSPIEPPIRPTPTMATRRNTLMGPERSLFGTEAGLWAGRPPASAAARAREASDAALPAAKHRPPDAAPLERGIVTNRAGGVLGGSGHGFLCRPIGVSYRQQRTRCFCARRPDGGGGASICSASLARRASRLTDLAALARRLSVQLAAGVDLRRSLAARGRGGARRDAQPL